MMYEPDQFKREVMLRLAGASEGSCEYSYHSQAEFQRPGFQRFDAEYVLPLLGARAADDEPGADEGLAPTGAFQASAKRALTVATTRRFASPGLLTVIAKAKAAAVARTPPTPVGAKPHATSSAPPSMNIRWGGVDRTGSL